MSTSIISSNTITTGTAHSWTAAAEQLIVASNVILASTAGRAIGDLALDTLGVSIFGSVYSDMAIDITGDNVTFHVAYGGVFASTETTHNLWAIADTDTINTGTTIIIDGALSALQAFGIVSRADTDIIVTGEIRAGASGIYIDTNGDGDTVLNSGTITGGSRDVSALTGLESLFGSGVFVSGENSRITNLAGGVISSVAIDSLGYDGPGGIEYRSDVSGARLRNYGEVNSMNGYGVDFSAATNLNDTSFINHGTIQGGLGSYRGDSVTDAFVNRGLMDGDMDFGDGADDFDNRAGQVQGDVILGSGDDFYDGRLDSNVSGGIYGDTGNDTVYGGNNADLIEGGDNNDELRGNGGNDEIRGDDGDDMMLGNDGDDELIGGNGNDSLFGGRGDDVLNGGNDNDRINGGDGNDRIIAGGGTDILFGDAGADTFTFSSTNDSGLTGATRDRIFDFDEAEGDILFLASIDADDITSGNQVFAYIEDNAFSGTAGELRYTAAGMVEGDTNGDGSANFQILLTTAPTLTEDAFVL